MIQDALQKLADAEKERTELQKKLENKEKFPFKLPVGSHRGLGFLANDETKRSVTSVSDDSSVSSRGTSEEKELSDPLNNNNDLVKVTDSVKQVTVDGESHVTTSETIESDNPVFEDHVNTTVENSAE